MGFGTRYDTSCVFFATVIILSSLIQVCATTTPDSKLQERYRFSLGYDHVVTWNPERDPWLRLYVMMCGAFCDENQKVEVEVNKLSVPYCKTLCYKCDCDDMCAVYGTCCPQVDPSTPLRSSDKTIRDYRRSHRLYFVGNLSDLKLKDSNVFAKYSIANPGREIDQAFDGRFQCVPVDLSSESTESVFGIAHCSEKETDQHLRLYCESTDPDLASINFLSPISDKRSGIVFKNVYCLKCWQRTRPDFKKPPTLDEYPVALADYDDHMYLRWNVSIKCSVYQGLYKITNISEFLSSVLKSIHSSPTPAAPFCSVKYKFSDTANAATPKPKQCYPHSISETPQCKGDTASTALASSLCSSVNKPAYSVSGSHNVFCNLCDGELMECPQLPIPAARGYITISSPINFLLGDRSAVKFLGNPVNTFRANETYLCPQHLEWMDESDKCQLPICADGKLLDDGECKTAIPIIEGLGYKLAMVLTPDQKFPSAYPEFIQDRIELLYEEMMESGYLALYMVVFGTDDSNEHDVIKYITIQGNFVAKAGMKRDEFERSFLNYNFRTSLKLDQNITVSLVPGGMGVDHVEKMALREHTLGNPEDQYHMVKAWDTYDVVDVMYDQPMGEPNDTPFLQSTLSRDPTYTLALKDVLFVEVGSPQTSHPTWNMKSDYVDISPTLLCPFVVFDIKDTTTINETKLLITFFYKGHEMTIDTSTHGMNLTIEGQKVKICIETFREVFQKTIIQQEVTNKTEIEITWMSAIKRHLTICCLLLSVICLLLTSITYCLFSQLRTLPGLNTLSLCLTLASAHGTLILVVELVGYVDGYVCIALGIALHYTWLSSFCWMGVCCVHMYLVFRGSNTRQASTQSPKDKHTIYIICAFGTSAVIVSVHICVCEIVSNGETTGYSDQICFFDTEWSIFTVIISFVAPLVTLLAVNTVLFGITVREMVVVRRLQAVRRVKTRDELLTYVKLSTVTGVQWLVSLLAIKLNSDATDIAVALLVGLQGVFIFVSFTLNKNTRSLYGNMCGGSGVSLVGSGIRKTSQTSRSDALVTNITEV